MKNQLIKKGIVISGVLLIGMGIGASTWFLLREHAGRTSRPFYPNDIDSTDNQTTVRPSQTDTISDDEKPLTEKERVVQRAKSALMSRLSEAQRADPFMQKALEAIDSLEFFDLLEKDLTERQWNDFLESKGVPVTRGYPGLFGKVVPDIELADYEPLVRLKLAELFLTADPVDLTDPSAAARQRRKVYLELGKELSQTDMAAAAWFIETFGEDRDAAFRSDTSNDSPAFVWMTDVQQNAARIVANAETTGVNTPKTQESAPSWDLSSVVESPSVDSSETEEPTTLDTSQRSTMTDAEIMAEIEKSLTPKTPDIVTNERPETPDKIQSNFETTLKSRFSSERFEQAMSTLERYGPEEGLRRLRENDPEVAKQIENSRHRNKEEVSQ
jgi:hypothetical protein